MSTTALARPGCNSLVLLLTLLVAACGGGSGGGSTVVATTPAAPAAPAGLTATATAGTVQVALKWSAVSGATSYAVGRSTTSGGPYTNIANPSAPSYTDTAVTSGTTYYYVVSVTTSAGVSPNSSQVSATPAAPSGTAVNVSIDALSNRHSISPYVYGGSGSKDAASVTDSGISVVRWGGNAASTYNWQLGTYNADADWYFEDFLLSPPLNNPADRDSAQYIRDVQAAGSTVLTTMSMMGWVAQAQGWSFPAATWPAQCKFDPYNAYTGRRTPFDSRSRGGRRSPG
jgi:hypothetical protein